MPKPPAIRHVALRYMTEFHCIGPDCEETCCSNWTIYVDQKQLRKLQRATDKTPQERARFRDAVELNLDPRRDAFHFARLTQREDGTCKLLDEDRLCSIHRRYGERLLPEGCATYPRILSVSGNRFELAASLSCPEVARRCLLAEDATDVLEVDAQLAGAATVTQRVPDGGGAYRRHFDDIRGTFYQLLSHGAYPLSSRLFFLVYFAHRLSELLQPDAPGLDQARLAAEMAAMERWELLDELHERFRASDAPTVKTMEVIVRILALRLQGSVSPTFKRVLREVLASYAEVGAGVAVGTGEEDQVRVDPVNLWSAYTARRDQRLGAPADRMDLYFQNYARNSVMKDWFLNSPNLVVYVHGLLLRVAVLRFLLVSHPGAAVLGGSLANGSAEDVARLERLDALAVEVFFSFARTVEHNSRFLQIVSEALEKEMPTLAHSLALLKF